MTVTVNFTIDNIDLATEHAVVIQQGSQVVKLNRNTLQEIFSALRGMDRFFGSIRLREDD